MLFILMRSFGAKAEDDSLLFVEVDMTDRVKTMNHLKASKKMSIFQQVMNE